MHSVLKAFKFRIYPNNQQISMMNQSFGHVRFVWNKLVENFNNYDKSKESIKVNEMTLKKEYHFLNDVSAAILQQKRMDFNETKHQYFSKSRKHKLGRPSFKNRYSKQSFRLPSQKFKLNQNNCTIRLEKIGFVKLILDRYIPDDADIRSVTVSRSATGQYYASVLTKVLIEELPQTGKMIGIDVGLATLFSFSDGTKVENPRWFRDSQRKLKRAQQHLARKQKGSNHRAVSRLKVARIHEKIRNQRLDFLHNQSIKLIRDNDLIAVENLNISGMIKNRKLSKSIANASWNLFVNMLEYKSKWYGKQLVKIDRWFPSSKICHYCEAKTAQSMDLSVRDWTCEHCGTSHDRDINAAVNILNQGYKDFTGYGLNSAELVENRHGEAIRPYCSSSHKANPSEVSTVNNE